MRVKTFRGESMAVCLNQIRQELGKEAVILGSQSVREDGRRLCEVMAALEQPEPPAVPHPETPVRHPGGNGNGRGNGAAKPQPPTSGGQANPAAAPAGDWNREWGEIKGHLLALLRPRMDFTALTPRQRLALEYLEREGVDEAAELALYRSIQEHGENTVIPALSRMVRVKPLTPQAWPGVAHLFVGPSGVGKTTALLRLALAARAAEPGRPVTVVNADGGRAKGRMLLRHFAELSGLDYAEADSPSQFRHLLDAAADGAAIFIDTPSLRGEGTMAAWCAAMGLADAENVRGHLVLSPLFSPAQTEHYLRVYRCPPLSSLVWTKLDEACNYGSLVNMAHASSLPVSALAHGAELTQGMTPATGKAVWKLLFKHQLPGEYAETDAGA